MLAGGRDTLSRPRQPGKRVGVDVASAPKRIEPVIAFSRSSMASMALRRGGMACAADRGDDGHAVSMGAPGNRKRWRIGNGRKGGQP
jgi:hypothetical protein